MWLKKSDIRLKKKYGLKKIKVGHAGTLDPLATGLLIICTGKMTKSIDQFLNEKKGYTGKIKLGATTPSFDLETDIDKTYDVPLLDENILGKIETKFFGDSLHPMPFGPVLCVGVRVLSRAGAGRISKKTLKIED